MSEAQLIKAAEMEQEENWYQAILDAWHPPLEEYISDLDDLTEVADLMNEPPSRLFGSCWACGFQEESHYPSTQCPSCGKDAMEWT